MPEKLRLDFGNLPLVEVALRASFSQPLELTFSRINEIFAKLKDIFPHVTEPQTIEAAPGVSSEMAIGPGRITGVAFSGDPSGRSVTLQSHVAVVRWLKQFIGNPPEYPRFPVMRDALWSVIGAAQDAYRLEAIPIPVVNMSYVNFIQVTDYSRVLEDYFSPLVRVGALARADEVRKVDLAWREADLDLRFRLEKVQATLGKETLDGCRLTTVAGTHVPADGGDARESLDLVHNRLQVFFRDVISDQAKKEWDLREVSDD